MTDLGSKKAGHWFAWYPVRVMGGRWAWLRRVFRWTGGWVSQACGRDVWEYSLPVER